MTGQRTEVSADQLRESFTALFAGQGGERLLLSAMYNLDSMKVSPIKGNTDRAHTLDVTALEDHSDTLSF